LDGSELGRTVTMAFMLNPLYLTVSLYFLGPPSDSPCTGNYTLGLQYIKVYQGTY
jgi:hypothetical protein